MNNTFLGNKTKRSKNNTYKSNALKTLMYHQRGLPPSPNWSNSFSSINQKEYLIYISNSFIIVINIMTKSFEQMLSSNKIERTDKPNVLLALSNSILVLSDEGKVIKFNQQKKNGYDQFFFIEDLTIKTSQLNIQKIKTALIIPIKSIIIVSGKKTLSFFKILNSNEFQIKNDYSLHVESEITDMILIDNDLYLSSMDGSIIIFEYTHDYNSIKKKYVISSNTNDMIYSIDYDKSTKKVFTINKRGTLAIYDSNNYKLCSIHHNQFNDKSIDEHYLYFTLKCLSNNIVIVSSNEGRIFLFDSDKTTYKELSENPHHQSIFHIIIFENYNQLIFISSDHYISFFTLNDFNFIYSIATISAKASNLLTNEKESKVNFLTQNPNEFDIYSYSYNKKKNSLLSIKRIIKKDKMILMMMMINDYLALLMMNEVLIYDINQDITIKKYTIDDNAILISNNIKENNGHIYIGFKNGTIRLIKYSNDIEQNQTNTILIKEFNESSSIIDAKIKFIDNDFDNVIYSTNETDNKLHIYLISQIFSLEIYTMTLQSLSIPVYDLYVENEFMKLYFIQSKTLVIFDTPLNVVLKKLKYNNYQSYENSYQELLQYKEIISDQIESLFDLFLLEQTHIKVYNNTIITAQIDGIILVYQLLTDNNKKSVKYIHQIKAHYGKISDIGFISDRKIMSLGNDQSFKIWNLEECVLLNIKCEANNYCEEDNHVEHSHTINNFSMTQDHFFYQQSSTNSRKIAEEFELFYSTLDESLFMINDYQPINYEVLLFSYFKNDILNYMALCYLLDYEKTMRKKSANKNNNKSIRHLNALYRLIQHLLPKNIKIVYEEDNQLPEDESDEDLINYIDCNRIESTIKSLIQQHHYIDALLIVKALNLGINAFVNCLEMIKSTIYTKQMFQAIKIERIIQILVLYNRPNK